MKVFFFGNVNNYPFILAKEFKKKGHEVIVFIDSENLLYRPENRYEKYRKAYPYWIVDISFLRNLNFMSRLIKFRQIIKNYGTPDLAILNGSVCDYLTNIHCKKFFLSSGSDIEDECSYSTAINIYKKTLENKLFLRSFFYFFRKIILIKRQREIFKNCIGFSYLDKNIIERSERIFKSLNKLPKRFNLRPADMSDKTYSQIKPKKYEKINLIKIVLMARINWEPKNTKKIYSCQQDNKSIDILIKGVAKFVHELNGNVELTLFKKGKQIRETKKLISDLDIEKNVIWVNEVTQLELAKYYEYADLIADQFNPLSIMGTAALNGMLASRPILANNKSDTCIINDKYRNPNKNISNPNQLANYLKQIRDNPKILEIISKKGKRFIEENHNPKLIADVILNFSNTL